MTRPDTGAPAAPPAEPLAQARLAGVLRAVRDGILILDGQHRLAEANPAFVTLAGLGLPAEQLRGTHLPAGPASLRHLYREPAATASRLTAIMDGGRQVSDDRHAMADGKTLIHAYAPITDRGSTVGHLWQLRIVDTAPTGDPGDAAALVAALTAAAARRRGEFAAALAHEVRTPATSIAAFVELLDDPDLDTEDRHRAAATVRRNAARMLTLARDLVLLSDLESGSGPPGDGLVDPAELARTAAATASAAGTPVRVDTGRGPAVPGDRGLLLRAMQAVVGVVTTVCADGEPDPPAGQAPGNGGETEPGVLVVAAHDASTGWSVSATGPRTGEVGTEQLITARVTGVTGMTGVAGVAGMAGVGEPDEPRTAALCLLLARAIAARHGGDLTADHGPTGYTVTLHLPHQ